MEKNKQQFIVLGVIVAILIVAIILTVLRPRPKRPIQTRTAPAGETAPVVQRSAPQKKEIKSGFKSWGKDPFAIGGSLAEPSGGQLSLSGIIWDARKPCCIIDGKVVKAGDEVYGCKVITINKDNVSVRVGDEIKILKLGR